MKTVIISSVLFIGIICANGVSSFSILKDGFLPAMQDRHDLMFRDSFGFPDSDFFEPLCDDYMNRFMERMLRRYRRLDNAMRNRKCVGGGDGDNYMENFQQPSDDMNVHGRKTSRRMVGDVKQSQKHSGTDRRTPKIHKQHGTEEVMNEKLDKMKNTFIHKDLIESPGSIKISFPGFTASQIKIKREASDQVMILAKRNDPNDFELIRKRFTLPDNFDGKKIIATYNGQTVTIKPIQTINIPPMRNSVAKTLSEDTVVHDHGKKSTPLERTDDEYATVTDETGE